MHVPNYFLPMHHPKQSRAFHNKCKDRQNQCDRSFLPISRMVFNSLPIGGTVIAWIAGRRRPLFWLHPFLQPLGCVLCFCRRVLMCSASLLCFNCPCISLSLSLCFSVCPHISFHVSLSLHMQPLYFSSSLFLIPPISPPPLMLSL